MPLFRNKSRLIHFIHIPKTGGTSVEHSLIKSGAIQALFSRKKDKFSKVTMQHLHYDYYNLIIPSNFADWSFAIVRNPFSRIMSEYKMKILKIRKSDQSFDSFVLESFESCLRNKQHRDNHIRQQKDFISDYLDIFKLENGLELPLKKACQKLEIRFSGLSNINTSSSIKVKASEKVLDEIRLFYKEDFLYFNYDSNTVPDSYDVTRN